MSLDPIFNGKVQNARLNLDHREMFDKYLHTLSGEVQVIVRKKRKDRSNNQNRYYFGVIIKILSDETGYFPQEIHEAMKIKFLQIEGAKFPVARSTSDLSTVETEDYYSKIRMWASSELGIYIPNPNEIV